MSQPEIRILADGDDLCRVAAEEFVRLADEAVRARGRFTVALSGGSTPEALYRLLAAEDGGFRARVPWGQAHFFWGDERHVPPDHPDSNYRMAYEAMLSRVPVPPGNVHRIPAENPDAAEAAAEYAQTLRRFFDVAAGRFPRFDLILLGMGSDGHTASLFAGTDAVHDRTRLVAAPWVETAQVPPDHPDGPGAERRGLRDLPRQRGGKGRGAAGRPGRTAPTGSLPGPARSSPGGTASVSGGSRRGPPPAPALVTRKANGEGTLLL